jgi:hypothetical protein
MTGPGEHPEPAVPQPDPAVGEPRRPIHHEFRGETLPTTPATAEPVPFGGTSPELLAVLHQFSVGGVGDCFYRLVVLGPERVAMVIIQSEAVRHTLPSPTLRRGEAVPIVDPTHPIQR